MCNERVLAWWGWLCACARLTRQPYRARDSREPHTITAYFLHVCIESRVYYVKAILGAVPAAVENVKHFQGDTNKMDEPNCRELPRTGRPRPLNINGHSGAKSNTTYS